MSASWDALLDGMVVYKAHGEVAINKPLLVLMILAHAQRGGENTFRFRDMADDLTKALRDFGTDRKTVHPKYPFWHLQYDGFWEIEGADEIPVSGAAGSPTKKALLDSDVVGYVRPRLWEELRKNPDLVRQLARRLLVRFWPDTSLHSEIAKQLGLTLPGSSE
jgi:predicted restriction endonuclease